MKPSQIKLSLLAMLISSATVNAAILPNGEIAPSENNTGPNYTGPTSYTDIFQNLPYLNLLSDGSVELKSPISGDVSTIMKKRQSNYLAEDSGGDFDLTIDTNGYNKLGMFRGNLLSSGDPANPYKAIFNVGVNADDNTAFLYLYQNYANNAEIYNSANGASIIIDNTAENATLHADSTSTGFMYIYNNIVTGADIQNNSENSTFHIINNDANNASIANSGTMIVDGNLIDAVNFKNGSTGNIKLDNNTANGATFDNSGYISMNNNTANNAIINNSKNIDFKDNNVEYTKFYNTSSGVMNFIGNSTNNGYFENSGLIVLDNNQGLNAEFNNSSSGKIYFNDNTISGSTINNDGYMHAKGNTAGSLNVINNGVIELYNNNFQNTEFTNNSEINIKDNLSLGGNSNVENTSFGNIYLNSDNSTPVKLTINGNLNNDGNIYLSDLSTSAKTQGNQVNVSGDLNGNGNYYIKTIVSDGIGDSINVGGSVNGNNILYINDTGVDPKNKSLKVVTAGKNGTGDFILNGDTVDVGTYRYVLEKNGNNWSLVNPNATLSTAANAAIGMQSAISNMWDIELGTLMNRLGDLRLNSDSAGFWIKENYKRMHVSPNSSRSYTQKYNSLQLGADKPFDFNGGTFHVGGFLGFSNSSLDFKENNSTGQVKSRSFGVYGTTLLDSGLYIDTLLKFSRIEADNSFNNNAGYQVKSGNYTSNSWGASVELGKRFTVVDDWFVEPQFQFSAYHTESSNYKLTNGMEVHNNSNNTASARIGGIAGTKFEFNDISISPYVGFSHIQNLNGDNEAYINSDKLDVDNTLTRQRYTIGANLNIYKNSSVYLDMNYEHGSKIEQPYGINIGYRFSF
ncbi:outer membrane autotransporter protein [Orbus hercynius]|uniref:Outer membrane autotransporter protein n=1 Tax=Orbus hercynius TaxID=593135 RepID=A0A495RJU9_9GAMM|nr:autotransporter outer membrane beta-barrel domain-containing protein [Orbus hercynius]RKS87436.1 outer membrane autotransporter protein [Orbus hercynius]